MDRNLGRLKQEQKTFVCSVNGRQGHEIKLKALDKRNYNNALAKYSIKIFY